jgi:hypothetical protein
MRPTNLSAPEIKYVAHAGQRFGRLTFVDEYHDGRNRKCREGDAAGELLLRLRAWLREAFA